VVRLVQHRRASYPCSNQSLPGHRGPEGPPAAARASGPDRARPNIKAHARSASSGLEPDTFEAFGAGMATVDVETMGSSCLWGRAALAGGNRRASGPRQRGDYGLVLLSVVAPVAAIDPSISSSTRSTVNSWRDASPIGESHLGAVQGCAPVVVKIA
jgi:hypothetical protein